MQHIAIIVHNVRSAYNVGSLFRTADGAGVSHVYLTGYTPAPVDRFGRVRKDIAKTALGAQESVPWTHTRDIHTCIDTLRKSGYTIVSVEQAPSAVPYMGLRESAQEKLALIFGSETEGLLPDVLDASDIIVEIPMHGTKESLNVSVAAGVVLFSLQNCA